MPNTHALTLPGTWLAVLEGDDDPWYKYMFRYYRVLPFSENNVFHGVFFAENPNQPIHVKCSSGYIRVLLWQPEPGYSTIKGVQIVLLEANPNQPEVVIAAPGVAVGLLSTIPGYNEVYITNASAPTGSNIPGLYEELLHYTDPNYVTFNPTGVWEVL